MEYLAIKIEIVMVIVKGYGMEWGKIEDFL